MVALCELELYSFIFLLCELRDTCLVEVVIPIKSQLAVLTHTNVLLFFTFKFQTYGIPATL